MKAPRVHLSQLQIIGLGAAMAEAYDAELGRYKTSVTDKSLAASMPFACNMEHVKRLRLQMFGHFKPQTEAVMDEACANRIVALEARIASLETMEQRFAAIEKEWRILSE